MVLGAELGNETLPVSYCHRRKLTNFPEILSSPLTPFPPAAPPPLHTLFSRIKFGEAGAGGG